MMENKHLQEELAAAREEVASLKSQLEDAHVQLEIQKSTLHEGHLRAAEAARKRYAELEARYNADMTDSSARLSAVSKDLEACRAALEAERAANADLLWRMDKVSEDALAARTFSASAVLGQLSSFAAAVGTYGKQASFGAFRTWARSIESLKLERMLQDRDAEIKLLKYKGGVDMLAAVFRKWMNSAKFSAWNQWFACVMETRQEQALARLLASMTVEQRAAALSRLQYIISAWTGKMQHLAFFDWKAIVRNAKDLRHRADMGARKLIRTRMWRGMRSWADFTRWSRNSRHEAQLADLRARLQLAEEERDRYMRRLDQLMEKFLLSRQGAFFDKCDRMLKAWKFGTIALMFQDWGQWAKATRAARLAANGDEAAAQQAARLNSALDEIAALQKKLAAADAEVKRLQRDNALQVDEIAMWKTKLASAEAEIPKADAEGYARAVAEYELKMDELAERLLSKVHGAFADKCNRIMKAWKFGTISLFFGDWKKVAHKGKQNESAALAEQVKGLQSDLQAERDRCAQLQARVSLLEQQLASLREDSSAERVALNRRIEELEEELAHSTAALQAANEARARDVQHERDLAAAAAQAADARLSDLTAENQKLKSEADRHRLKTEDLDFRLKDAHQDNRALVDKEAERDQEQQAELDNLTADNQRLKTKLMDKEAMVVKSNQMAEDYKAMLEKSDVSKQAALSSLEKKKKRCEALEAENEALKSKAGAYEQIYDSSGGASQNKGWFKPAQ